MHRSKKILIITHDKVGVRMAGPGMRYHQIALELAKHFAVTLAAFKPDYIAALPSVPYRTTYIDPHNFRAQFDEADVVIALWLSEEMITHAKSADKLLVFDLYAPVPVEDLVAHLFKADLRPETDYNYGVMLDTYKRSLAAGDLFLTSNETQRDFWTGFAFAGGSIAPSAYRDFPLYERTLLCPMGINLDELKSAGKTDPLRGHFPQIKKDDFVLVWTGGIWDWFDALTPIRAMKRLKDEGINNVRLVFLGTRHPNPDIPRMSEVDRATALAEELGLRDHAVFFLDGWLRYDERLDYFMAASAALYAHKPSIEARFSHRTRVLDHFLTALPTVATAGDHFADVIAQRDLGKAVEPGDDRAMAAAIKALLDKEAYSKMRANVKRVQSEYTWEQTLRPLVTFLQEDHAARRVVHSSTSDRVRTLAGRPELRRVKRLIPRSVKESVKRHIQRS
jgi:hypothetical protein